MRYLLKPSQLQSLLDLASKGLIAPDTPFEDILPIYHPGKKREKKKVDYLGTPRLPGDEILDTFRRRLVEPWKGMCSELYEAMEITKGSAEARTFLNPQALGWHLKKKLDDGDAAYFKKRSNRGQQYTIQPLAKEENNDGQHS